MSIVLIGPPAAGKSRAGRRLAKRLGASYADTDKIIVQRHGVISEIFANEGEERFREIERDVVAESVRDYAVVSLGGGAVLNAQTQALLRDHTVVYLVARPEAIVDRINNDKRPLLRGIDSWIALFESRREVYESLADGTFDTSFRPMKHVVEDIATWLEKEDRLPPPTEIVSVEQPEDDDEDDDAEDEQEEFDDR